MDLAFACRGPPHAMVVVEGASERLELGGLFLSNTITGTIFARLAVGIVGSAFEGMCFVVTVSLELPGLLSCAYLFTPGMTSLVAGESWSPSFCGGSTQHCSVLDWHIVVSLLVLPVRRSLICLYLYHPWCLCAHAEGQDVHPRL